VRYVVLFAIGCGSSGPAPLDCKDLMADPSTTLSKAMERESDPAKVWELLERCAAPNGDTCDRAAAAAEMTPSMTSTKDPTYAVNCRTLSPEKQKCLLPSYSTSHADCGQVQEAFRRAFPPK
jgi:hypothetical protein